MPLVIAELSHLKDYIHGYPDIPVFYEMEEIEKGVLVFTVMAGKVAWQGEADRELEGFLEEHGGILVKGYADLEALFA